ncbi:MAG TPA: hypothetical protein VFQ70_03695 [Candidatus Saccharimonadaceae bacterium]|nr:hypothetical protein [Candidatus Saccharimonadaceae bacterium]
MFFDKLRKSNGETAPTSANLDDYSDAVAPTSVYKNGEAFRYTCGACEKSSVITRDNGVLEDTKPPRIKSNCLGCAAVLYINLDAAQADAAHSVQPPWSRFLQPEPHKDPLVFHKNLKNGVFEMTNTDNTNVISN